MVAEEEDVSTFALGTFCRLDPLAHAGRPPHGTEEAHWPSLDIRAVVLTHDGLDGLGSLVGVVKRDGAHVVVKNMGFDDAVEKMAADEAKVTVNGGSGSTDKSPRLWLIVRERRVRVLKEGDGNKPVVDP